MQHDLGLLAHRGGPDEADKLILVQDLFAAEAAGGVLLLLGIYPRTVSLLTLPVIAAVAWHWMVRKGFWFGDGGAEFE